VVIDAAYEACLRLARQHYENFPVASYLLPKASRPHIAAIYAFARIADDFADEGDRDQAARLVLLDDWQRRLHAAASAAVGQDGSDADRIFAALGHTIRTFDLDVGLFDDLLSAFRQDVVVTRYETWADLLDYCRRSANPIGRLVLRVSGYDDRALDARADAVCTALQLTNFWQDVEIDWLKGRLYAPGDFVRDAHADENDLGRKRMSPEWQAVLGRAAAATRDLFAEGRSIADEVAGRLKWELRATWLGGVRILDRLDAVHFDVFRHRPALGWPDAGPILWRAIRWR
jgi:phytoene synthase